MPTGRVTVGRRAAKTAKPRKLFTTPSGITVRRAVARVADHEVVSPVAEEVARDDLRRQCPVGSDPSRTKPPSR